MTAASDDAFGLAMERVERLIDGLERQPDSSTVQQARELLHAVLEVHGIGLGAIWQRLCADGGGGAELAASLAGDPRVAALLNLHALEAASEPVTAAPELIPAARLLRSGRGGGA